MTQLPQQNSQVKIGKTGYLTLYDREGQILYHPNQDYIMKTAKDMGYSQNIMEALQVEDDSNAMLYEREGIPYCGSVAYLDEMEWRIVACMPKQVFFNEVRRTATIVIIGFTFCAIVLTAVTVLISIAIVKPIRKPYLSALDM